MKVSLAAGVPLAPAGPQAFNTHIRVGSARHRIENRVYILSTLFIAEMLNLALRQYTRRRLPESGLPSVNNQTDLAPSNQLCGMEFVADAK